MGKWGTKEWERGMGNERWGTKRIGYEGREAGRATERKRRIDQGTKKRQINEERRDAHRVRCQSLNTHDDVSTNHQPPTTANHQPSGRQHVSTSARQLQAPHPRDAKTPLRRPVTPGCTPHGEDGEQGVELVEMRRKEKMREKKRRENGEDGETEERRNGERDGERWEKGEVDLRTYYFVFVVI